MQNLNFSMLVRPVFSALLTLLLAANVFGETSGKPSAVTLSRDELEDKIRGGWAGQMIGVSYGAASEFHYQGRINEDPLPWKPEMVSEAIEQDDLYVEMSFIDVLDRQGLDATTIQFGEALKQSHFGLCHGNAAARRLLDAGFSAPLSGDPRLNSHANDIDFQMESDFIGLSMPGLPLEALELATRVGRVVSHGEGLLGGIYISAMYAAAFTEHDPAKMVSRALLSLPAQSEYSEIIHDTVRWSLQNPTDWRKTWKLLQDKWARPAACPDEALAPFLIQAKLNGAYVTMGLLYGHGDFGRTLEIATRQGQDSDCNPSTAGGILGALLGYSAIPDKFKSGIPPLADRPFSYTNYSLNEVVQSTLKRALAMVKRAGGLIEGERITIPIEQPRAAPFESWTTGRLVSLIPASAPSWHWMGNDWTAGTPKDSEMCGPKFDYRAAARRNLSMGLRHLC